MYGWQKRLLVLYEGRWLNTSISAGCCPSESLLLLFIVASSLYNSFDIYPAESHTGTKCLGCTNSRTRDCFCPTPHMPTNNTLLQNKNIILQHLQNFGIALAKTLLAFSSLPRIENRTQRYMHQPAYKCITNRQTNPIAIHPSCRHHT
jgi:hypothetical protein